MLYDRLRASHLMGISDTERKRDRLQSKGEQDDGDLSKRAETEREKGTKRPGTGA